MWSPDQDVLYNSPQHHYLCSGFLSVMMLAAKTYKITMMEKQTLPGPVPYFLGRKLRPRERKRLAQIHAIIHEPVWTRTQSSWASGLSMTYTFINKTFLYQYKSKMKNGDQHCPLKRRAVVPRIRGGIPITSFSLWTSNAWVWRVTESMQQSRGTKVLNFWLGKTKEDLKE